MIDSLLRLSRTNGLDSPSTNGPDARMGSPPGGSILMTRAPISASCIVANGPAMNTPSSSTVTPESGPAVPSPFIIFLADIVVDFELIDAAVDSCLDRLRESSSTSRASRFDCRSGEQLGQCHSVDACEILGLGATGEAVGQVDRIRRSIAQCWQQCILCHRHRGFVMALLHAEVAGQTAASREFAHRCTCAFDELPVCGETHDGMLVAVRLDDDRAACE